MPADRQSPIPTFDEMVERATDDLLGVSDPTGEHYETAPLITNQTTAEEAARRTLAGAPELLERLAKTEAENALLRGEVAALHAERETTRQALADWERVDGHPLSPLAYVDHSLGTTGHAYLVRSVTDAIYQADIPALERLERYETALREIADGDVSGEGDWADCVIAFARAALPSSENSNDTTTEGTD